MKRSMLLAAAVIVTAAPLLAEDHWPRFRGTNGVGVSDAKSIPTSFADADVRWKTQLPGVGHSSPVVWGDKLFVTSGDSETGLQHLHAVDTATGKLLWTKSYKSDTFRMHRFNSYASATCAVDAERVYFVRTSAVDRSLISLTHDGKEVWTYPLGAYEAQHGSGTSPIVHDGMVVFANDQIANGFLVALDAATGEERWKIARPGLNAAYATPCLVGDGAGATLVFASQASGVTGVKPADGKIIWELKDVFPKRVVSSPVVAGGHIIVSCGQGGGGEFLAGVVPGSADAPAKVGWKLERAAPYVPTSVEHDGLLFVISDGGVGTCLDPKNGAVKWQERVGGNGYFASPVVVNGVVYVVGRDGKVVTYRAADKFERVGEGDLGEEAYASPAVAGDRMFLRSVSHVVCIGGRPLVDARGVE